MIKEAKFVKKDWFRMLPLQGGKKKKETLRRNAKHGQKS